MPRPAYRSKGIRRVATRTPGGRTVTHYERRRDKGRRCPVTGLSIPEANRPYGGVFSHKVLARAIKNAVRKW
ncbi:MAG: 50S ribosomal protein L34e [Pyrobaculum sp.]